MFITIKSLLSGVLLLAMSVSQGIGDKTCFAPVVCSDEESSHTSWLQVFPHPTCHWTDGSNSTERNGAKGEKGEKGEQGFQGGNEVQGQKGENGDQGLEGEKGKKGDQGLQGANGVQGEKGEKGQAGEPGITGPIGPMGPNGTEGQRSNSTERSCAKGEKGEKGEQGFQGGNGLKGQKGENGIGGLEGENGSGGLEGEKGEKGDQGLQGANGVQGEKGEEGRAGAPGITGPIGPMGPNGTEGQRGNPGLKGERGKDADVDQIMDLALNILSVTSCDELVVQYGINRTGYYLMRADGASTPVYNYCDFQIYEGIATCAELPEGMPNVTGYYRFRENSLATPTFVRCVRYFTCLQLQEYNGTKVTGVYTMSPGNESYQVHCHFSSGLGAVTEVWHTSMQEIKAAPRCEKAGCYSWSPEYEIDANSILKIIENSRECRQYIKASCKHSILLRNSYFSWWVSRQGEKMLYWGGATSRRDGYCACGETGSCSDKQWKCNCDRNDDTKRHDDGFLTDKTKLPVRELRFGEMGASGEYSWHTLEALECMG